MNHLSLSVDEILQLGIQRTLDHHVIFAHILAQGSQEQKIMAARSLGWLRSEQCAYALIDALYDADAEVRRWVAASLALSWADQAESILQQCFVQESNAIVRATIIRTLGWHCLPHSASLCLTVLYQDEVAEVRAEATKALGRIDAPSYVQDLIYASSDASPLVRRYAIRALLSQTHDQVLDLLLRRSIDEDAETRAVSVRALGYWTQERSQRALIKALDDVNPCVRLNAIVALGKHQNIALVPLLESKTTDPHKEVRSKALETVQIMTKNFKSS